MRAIVTGGAGFIGSNLVDALLDQGAEVDVIDTLVTGRRSNLEPARWTAARGCTRSTSPTRAELTALVGDVAPDVIFHLAAQIDVRKSIEDPALDAGVNVVGTINVLEAARVAGVGRVVNTSTGGAIYGDADTIPSPETHRAAADGRLRPDQVLRRALPRAGTAASTASPTSRCAWATSTARARTRSARPA